MGYFGSGDYKDIKPSGSTVACPKCGAPCISWTEAQAHCQKPWNSKICLICNGVGLEYGRRCSKCNGTGRVGF